MLQRSVSIEIEDLDGSGDVSNDVCNYEGSTCPENICCRQELCDKEGNGIRCCEDPDTDPVGCANCPKCGELTYKTQITKLTQFIIKNLSFQIATEIMNIRFYYFQLIVLGRRGLNVRKIQKLKSFIELAKLLKKLSLEERNVKEDQSKNVVSESRSMSKILIYLYFSTRLI